MNNTYMPNQMPSQPQMQGQYQQPYVESAEQRYMRLMQQYNYPSQYNPQQMQMPMPGQQQMPQAQPAQSYECKPVTSIDEVKAVQVDFTGKPQFFINNGAGEVYVKVLNDMGSSDILAGKLQKVDFASGKPVFGDEQPEQTERQKYVTFDDLEDLREELAEMIGGKNNERIHETANDAATDAEPARTTRKQNARNTAKSNVSASAEDDAG